MSIRFPLQQVMSFTSSIASAVTDAAVVNLPQDADSVTVMVTSSVFGITTLKTFIQTTTDGGANWLDMGCIGVITATTGGTPATALQQPWVAHFDVIGSQQNQGTTSVVSVGSVVGRSINQVGASVIGAGQYTGIPLLSPQMRIFHVATGTGASDILTRVFVQSQSASA